MKHGFFVFVQVDPSSTQPAAFLMNKKGKPAKASIICKHQIVLNVAVCCRH